MWERTTPRIQCLNPFLFINSSYTEKKFEKFEKFKKSEKKSKKFDSKKGFFFEDLKSVHLMWK